MTEKIAKKFPHIFRPTTGSDRVFSLWFDTAQFAQLALSNFHPYQCKNYSKLNLAASVLNIADGVGVCKCLAPVNFFAHAFATLATGNYSEDVKDAVVMLERYIEEEEKHAGCISKMVKQQDRLSEKEILLVYAHHLFEPLLPRGELLIDKCIEAEASGCPFCPGKKDAVKSGSTTFGVPEMWHGSADLVIKHGKIQQTVTVRHELSDSSDEPEAKRQRIDTQDQDVVEESSRTEISELKNDLNWLIMSKTEQDHEPIPRLLSQTIVNAFLVTKGNDHLRIFFIPSFLVTPKGVMIVMYNLSNDSLVAQVKCHPLLLTDKEMDKRVVFTIWLALNFDKFCLDQSVKVIEKFLKPCGFRKKLIKHDVLGSYEEDVRENVEERNDGDYGVYDTFLDTDARRESWKILTSLQGGHMPDEEQF